MPIHISVAKKGGVLEASHAFVRHVYKHSFFYITKIIDPQEVSKLYY